MHFNLSYGPHPRHKIDLYRKRSRKASRGLIFFLYGGTWREGERQTYRLMARCLAAQGYDVAIPDYRLFPEVRYPTFMEDAALALHWLHQKGADYSLDPNRLFLMGHSAGAYMGALMITNERFLEEHDLASGQITAFIGLAGPYSFNPLDYTSTSAVFETASPIADARPIKHVSGHEPPMLLLHGLKDKTVYPQNTENLAKAVNDAGGSAELILYPSLGHKSLVISLFPILRWRASVLRDITAFLDRLG